jgi:type IV secretory pathway TraG/TraD family ATPase VirD4
MNDPDQPEIAIFAPTSSGKGTGNIIPDLLQSEPGIVVVDLRADLSQFYQPGGDA